MSQYSFISSTGADNSRLPAYARIEQDLRRRIESTAWQPGDMIPTEAQLALQHKVSVGTVRKALQELVVAGLLYRVQGKGTYVAGSFIRSKNHRFYRTQRSFNDAELATSFSFISRKVFEGDAILCGYLGIPEKTRCIRLERLISIDECPFVVVRSHFEAKRFPGLMHEAPSRFEKEALTLIIENDFGTPTMSAHELYGAATASTDVALVLNLQEGSPVLYMEMLCCTYNETPFEYRQSYCVPGRKLYRSY